MKHAILLHDLFLSRRRNSFGCLLLKDRQRLGFTESHLAWILPIYKSVDHYKLLIVEIEPLNVVEWSVRVQWRKECVKEDHCAGAACVVEKLR
jgi:hypothetical protein